MKRSSKAPTFQYAHIHDVSLMRYPESVSGVFLPHLLVQLGPVRTQGEEFKGLMVEVEYRPLGSLSIGQPLLQEFVTILQQVSTNTHHARSVSEF